MKRDQRHRLLISCVEIEVSKKQSEADKKKIEELTRERDLLSKVISTDHRDASHRRRNRGGNGGARPRNAETAGAKVYILPRNNLSSLSAR